MRNSLKINTSHDDRKLLDMFRDTEDIEFLGQLYNRYLPLVYGLCLKYLKNSDDARDAVMQIFENIIHKIKSSEIRDFKNWLYVVAKNHCLQELRKKKREIPLDSVGDLMEYTDIVHLLSKGEDEKKIKILEKCLGQLPAPQKESIILFFMEEKSYAEICDITHYQLKSIKSYIQNGKRNLKICIESHFK